MIRHFSPFLVVFAFVALFAPFVCSSCTDPLVNAALGIPATFSWNSETGTTNLATDGDLTSVGTVGKCMYSDNSAPTDWFRIDLGAVYNLETVGFLHRSDCCQNRASGIQIAAGLVDSPSGNAICATITTTPSGQLVQYPCAVSARYVYFLIGTGTNLFMCETQAMVCNVASTTAAPTTTTTLPPTTTTAHVTGDPHFSGFDGSEFDFMGNEDGAVYALYSSLKLHVNGRFKIADKQKYPQYDKPMFMDVITVICDDHRLEYNIYEAPLYNGASFPLQNNFDRRVIFSTDKFSLIAEFVTVMFEISGLFRINVTMFRDNWSTPYMDVRLMLRGNDGDPPVKGIIGSTLPRLGHPDGTLHEDRAAISIASGSGIAQTISMTADHTNEATTTSTRTNVFWESYFNEHEADYRVKGDNIYGFECVQCMYGTVI